MDQQKEPRRWMRDRLKFVVSVLDEHWWSTGTWLGQMVLSGTSRIGRTTILWILDGNGPLINIVALQLSNVVQNEDHDDALTWSINLSSTWAMQSYLIIWRCWKRFHTIWINQNGTSFTNIPTDQKLAKILEEKCLDETCPKWVEVGYINNRRPRKIGSHNGGR